MTTQNSPPAAHPPTPLANVNGETLPLAEAKVPALDRGFLFGDAVYEVVRVYRGKPWLIDDHLGRLGRSLEAIKIHGVDLDRLRRRALETIAAGPFDDATVYVQVSRGAAPRTHKFPAAAKPFEFLYVQEFTDPYTEYRTTGAAALTYPDIRWDRCDVKSTNLLANVLAMQAAAEAGCVEALFYLPDGTLTEGTHTSFFGVRDGTVLTRPRGHDILPGITRGLIMKLADRGAIPVREQSLTRLDLAEVSELFLTGTTSEVLPIVIIDGQPVASGIPGPVTRRLQDAYADAVQEFVEGSSAGERGA